MENLRNKINYRAVQIEELNIELFDKFKRHQNVTHCWRKIDGEWLIKEVRFVEEWGKEEYAFLSECLKGVINTDGVVYGAFSDGILKGFTSVDGDFLGKNRDYINLSSIHVSEDMRGYGIGRELFKLASKWAKARGAKRLYISAHSSVESQAFYKSLGCVEAVEYDQKHVEKEPCDCQLEYIL
ncbi:GNAT family N-acetyltransferase [Clostridium intestinale]|uniref:GNAT family N-acetyltransferase n=1 Tax=Clostridium intestinale TaxID=36845 RepID=UPI0028E838D0|nr:GNAT family N-acetyltransferase [Clostridium intestinale]